MQRFLSLLLLSLAALAETAAAQTQRARDWGIPFEGTPGQNNAITDVKGVEVGYTTLISGEGKNKIGKGPVRTGITAIFPTGKTWRPIFANWYTLNGNGEMTGTTWVTGSGMLETPIMITNTNSVGVVRDATLKWFVKNNWYKKDVGFYKDYWYTYPVVAETYDGVLNDIYGFHVKEEHVFAALDNAKGGPIAEGNVGGGTGMFCLGFKGGTGTSSRQVKINDKTYAVGVLVQSNFGSRANFTIAGVPVGKELMDTLRVKMVAPPESIQPSGQGSIIVIVATDAPLLPHQLKRIAERVSIGVGMVGGRGENSSGDIFFAFSTADTGFSRNAVSKVEMLANDLMDPLFNATVNATQEAIINAMVSAKTLVGVNGNTAYALPKERVIKALKKYNRYKSPSGN
ncbi:MAG TPA: P1 family peptidase [Hymenobacter sp.]|jgi:L-aminopeptidase/D-esterase-like protein|uniref:DmpA family aminopeptidase n=1 Tax=Hymenobacter sp. TaxID=1898978 RepID=UPI002ED7DDCE